jgi:hypothetical protein
MAARLGRPDGHGSGVVRAVLGRGLAALLLLSALASAAQPVLLAQLIPLWRVAIEALEPDFRVVDMRATATGIEPLIELVVTPARIIIIGTRAIVPEGSEQAAASMSRGAVWLLLTVFLVTLAAWPIVRPAREWPMRLALGLPLLSLLLLVDVPVTLLGPLRSLITGMASEQADAWVVGARFLRGGGRYLVAIAGAALICLLSLSFSLRKNTP